MVGLALIIRFYSSGEPTQSFVGSSKPLLREPGSEHSHMSIMLVVNGTSVNFYHDKYVDKSEYAHFHPEDIGGYFIHKHASGVTLSYFLDTLGMKLTPDCLTLETGIGYCDDGKATLSLYINRRPYEGDISFYELRDGDKILINYSTSTAVELMLEANGIPDIPEDLSQHG